MIGDRWGVTAEEVAQPYPCDAWVTRPTMSAWRGVTVRVPVEKLWPWVTQVRWAPYSYDWLDNLGRRSPQVLLDRPAPAVGDPFTSAAGRDLGRVLAVAAPHQLTGRLSGVVISYVLVPHDGGTRLLMKLVSELPRLVNPLLSVGDLVMARRQLLNWKRLAERAA